MNDQKTSQISELRQYERTLKDGLKVYRLDVLEYNEVVKTIISLQTLIQELSNEDKFQNQK